jgi:hypothetical protein
MAGSTSVTRLRYLGEFAIIAAAVALGAVWPTVYTLVGVLVAPALVVALVALIMPRWVQGPRWRNGMRVYMHGATALSATAVVSLAAVIALSHSDPVDIIVQGDTVGRVVVVYNIPNGAPDVRTDGRQVLEIPVSRVLLTQASPSEGWWRAGERRFFVRDPDGLRPVAGGGSSSGVASSWSGCTARFDYFVIRPDAAVSEEDQARLEDSRSWGLQCEGGRLTRR